MVRLASASPTKSLTKMLDKSKWSYIHFVWPSYGYAFVTYDYIKEDPIEIDETVYHVRSLDNKATMEFAKIIANISGKNYLQCKKIIESNGIIYSGKATDVLDLLIKLKEKIWKLKSLHTFPIKLSKVN